MYYPTLTHRSHFEWMMPESSPSDLYSLPLLSTGKPPPLFEEEEVQGGAKRRKQDDADRRKHGAARGQHRRGRRGRSRSPPGLPRGSAPPCEEYSHDEDSSDDSDDSDGSWGSWDPEDNPATSHGYTSRREYEQARARQGALGRLGMHEPPALTPDRMGALGRLGIHEPPALTPEQLPLYGPDLPDDVEDEASADESMSETASDADSAGAALGGVAAILLAPSDTDDATSATELLSSMSQPVLIEVPPSPSNIALPSQETEPEEWVAVEGGGFVLDDGTHDLSHLFTTFHKPRKTIRKRAKKVEYFVDHCENTKCTLRPGHAGLCSHEIVRGKRGGRVSRSVRSPVVYEPVFDLNDDSDYD